MLDSIYGVLSFSIFALIYGSPIMLLVQLTLLPSALGLLKRKQLSRKWALLLLIPYAGITAAYWIVATQSRENIK